MFIIFFYILLLISFVVQNFNFDLVYYQNIAFIIAISVITLFFNFKRIKFPKYPSLFFSGYLIFVLISLINNINNVPYGREHAFMQYGLQVSLFLFFIIGNSLKDDIGKNIEKYIYTIGFVSIIFYAFCEYFGHIYTPINHYQMYFFSNKSHNHIGDLAVLPIIISFFYLGKSRLREIVMATIFYFFCLFSYSRSAYLSLTTGLFLMLTQIRIKNSHRYSIFLMCFIMLVFSFILVRDKKYSMVETYKKLNHSITSSLDTNPKKLFSDREKFIKEAIYGIRKRPLLGSGINNFIVISQEYHADVDISANNKPSYIISTSHNMIVDIFSESGVFAFIFYILFLGYVLIYSEKNLYFILAVSMLVNFLFDYTFEIPPFILIFYLLLGVSYREKSNN